MNYFFDTEFHEYKGARIESTGRMVNTIELISIGIVAEDGREFYAVSNDFTVQKAIDNEWLKNNVLKQIYKELVPPDKADEFNYWNFKDALEDKGFSNFSIAKQILEFIGEDKQPEFYAYYADYDWVVFCWLFGRMIDLPKQFPMYCRDLKQMLDEKVQNLDNYELGISEGVYFPLNEKLKILKANHYKYPKQENEHNALADARWNKKLFEFLANL